MQLYFLSEVDQKKIMGRILPSARSAGVSEDLRGWNWNRSPMKPMYDERVPMYSICSKYCPTARDVFLDRVMKAAPQINENVILGGAIHRTAGAVINMFLDGQKADFERWYAEAMQTRNITNPLASVKEKSRLVWEHVARNCESRYGNRASEQPYASRRDVVATSVPLLVEHKVSGELLGLSGLLSVDCYDYLRGVVFDLKVTQEERDWYRLAPTGYAIVLESVYEVPIDVGCVSYAWFQGGGLRIRRDIFFINDDLRSWWLEERDAKIDMVAQRIEPSVAGKCYEDCIYWQSCRGEPKP